MGCGSLKRSSCAAISAYIRNYTSTSARACGCQRSVRTAGLPLLIFREPCQDTARREGIYPSHYASIASRVNSGPIWQGKLPMGPGSWSGHNGSHDLQIVASIEGRLESQRALHRLVKMGRQGKVLLLCMLVIW